MFPISYLLAILSFGAGMFCLIIAPKLHAQFSEAGMELPRLSTYFVNTSGWIPGGLFILSAVLLILFAALKIRNAAAVTSFITFLLMLACAALIPAALLLPYLKVMSGDVSPITAPVITAPHLTTDTPPKEQVDPEPVETVPVKPIPVEPIPEEPEAVTPEPVEAKLHSSMIPVNIPTGMSFTVSEPKLQALHDRGMQQLQKNLSEFAPGMTILVEGGGYDNAWLETQPMGGEMFAKHDLQVALNNQVLFFRGQRDDGRLPGMVITGSKVAEQGWDTKGFPAGYVWKPEHDIIADYEMFQGYCFPEPAWRMYHWTGKNREYLQQLYTALKGHDEYLWRTRDSNEDGLLETWCVWDTGEDGSTRLHQRGAKENWPYENAPGSRAPGLPEMPADSLMPIQSMDVMAYSYSGRAVLAKVAAELGTGDQADWQRAAEDVRQRVIQQMWDPERMACFDRDRHGQVLPELIHNNLRCMWYGMFTQQMADDFIKHHLLNPREFWTPVPLVSIARNEALFLSKPRNNWSGQPQGLTYQRAIHALERYGHYAEVTLLGEKLLPILIRNGQFSQQLHQTTGEPSLSNADGYGPMILAMQEYIARMHGIHIDVERGHVWWSGLLPDGWNTDTMSANGTRKQMAYSQQWGDRVFKMELQRNGKIKATINGQLAFTASPGTRVVTDLKGKPISVVGIDPEEQIIGVQAQGQYWIGTIQPNETHTLLPNSELKRIKQTAFDFPYTGR